ncbi:MAG TPA: DUF2993 domain-containing protein [Kineosporiaceae bacterium]|nr:DUF2993 domain-containing protein [Kineosporiaceae bacterium]
MRRVIVLVIVLLLLLAGLDFAARATAQAAIARQVRSSQHLSQDPRVEVTGFPFLLQAIRGRYDEVDVRMEQVPAGGQLRLDSLVTRLDGVHVPLGAAIGGQVTSVPVDVVHVRGTASFATLDAVVASAVPADLATVRFSDGGSGRLAVTVTYRGPGGPLTVSAPAQLSVSRGRLTVAVPTQSLSQVPAPLRPSVARLLTQTVPLPKLPLGLVADGGGVGPDGVNLTADATGVLLRAG